MVTTITMPEKVNLMLATRSVLKVEFTDQFLNDYEIIHLLFT